MIGTAEGARPRMCRRPACVGAVAFCAAAVLSGACASRRIALPTDPGSPLNDYSEIHAQVSSGCRDVRTLTAEMGLRGRAAGRRISGRVVAGFERPSSMRLEGVAPFGPPGFILAARGDTAVLLLPRDERFVKGASPSDLLGALTGVSLAPADLQAIVTGCVVPSVQPTGGRLHSNGWASIDLEGSATLYLKREGTWQVRAARRDGWTVEYPEWSGRFPATIRLRSDSGPPIEMTATTNQLEANVDIDPAAFTVTVPPSATPLSIEELRAAGPLGESE
jgi:hypothetical protein